MRNPVNGLLYAIVFEFANERRLVTLNPATGVATDIGVLDHRFAGLAFRANGTLIGITGNGDNTDPESLYTINTDRGLDLRPAAGQRRRRRGHRHRRRRFLYHASGIGIGDQFWERVNLDTDAVTDLGIYSFASATPSPSAKPCPWATPRPKVRCSCSTNSGDLYTINTATGHAEQVGSFSILDGVSDFAMKGLAFGTVCAPLPRRHRRRRRHRLRRPQPRPLRLRLLLRSPNYIPGADLDHDGDVDFIDLNIVLSFFGTAC